ncbi:MAG: hypothetical protein D6681_16305 [Calditrichaeota bacterium]|nr:MAG: hypothetical protein D6681_16305 [Calditrichota bacterium]
MRPTSIPQLPGKARPYIIAHRGNQVVCPENTLAAFRQALKDGADIIETDLHVSADGQFVCIHDPTVDRTTDGTGKVEEMTLAELKRFSAGYGRAEFAHERIPALPELIDLLPEDVALALELKSDRFLDSRVCERLAELLEQTGIRERTLVLSFSLPRLKAMQKAAPDIHTGWITLSRLRPLRCTHMLGPFWPILLVNPLYVRIAHARNQAVCPLDPRPDSRLWLYRLLGCDALLTDDPATTRQALRLSRNQRSW